MNRSLIVWLLIGVAAMGIAALAIPSSPVYLPKLLVSSDHFRGRSAAAWAAALKSDDLKLRQQAMHALGTYGASASESIPMLVNIMREDEDPEARSNAAQALSKMAPATATAVPALAEALKDEEPYVRMHAAIALFQLKSAARPAAAALLKALQDKNNITNMKTRQFTIQEMTALALGHATAGTDEAVAPLLAVLETTDRFDTRLVVMRALGEIGLPARPAESAVRKFLDAEQDFLREAAQETLQKIGAERPAAQKKQDAKLAVPPRAVEVVMLGLSS